MNTTSIISNTKVPNIKQNIPVNPSSILQTQQIDATQGYI